MRWLFLGATLLVASACTKERPPACTTVDLACAPLYTGAFATVYTQTISMDCGSNKGSCHSAGGDSGLSFATEQETYDHLLESYVTPGDPGCSEMIVRTSSPGKDYQMPQGRALSEPEQCALRKWVEAGAPR